MGTNLRTYRPQILPTRRSTGSVEAFTPLKPAWSSNHRAHQKCRGSGLRLLPLSSPTLGSPRGFSSHATRSAVELAAAAQVGHDTGPQAVIFVRYSPRQLSSVLLLNAIADSVRTADYPTTIVPLHCSPRRDATTPQNVSNTRAKRYFDVPVPHKEMSELAVRFVGAFAPRRHNEA